MADRPGEAETGNRTSKSRNQCPNALNEPRYAIVIWTVSLGDRQKFPSRGLSYASQFGLRRRVAGVVESLRTSGMHKWCGNGTPSSATSGDRIAERASAATIDNKQELMRGGPTYPVTGLFETLSS